MSGDPIPGARSYVHPPLIEVNAIKFTPAGGENTVSAGLNGGFGFVKIADTGKGVPEEDLPHIFERFYRSAKTAGSESEGAGLGLSIVKMIAELHKGSIAAGNNPGGGSTFLFRIPVDAV